MKKIKNKTEKIIFLIAIFQILLLINLTPAESYMIHQTDPFSKNNLLTNENDLGNKIKKIFGIGINLLIGFLSIKEIGFVSAASTTSCCPDTCDNVISTYTGCSQELIPTTCDNTDICKLGCCFDPVEGICSTNSPKGKCESSGGTWSSSTTCSITGCQKGCCVIGSNSNFMTEQQCNYTSQSEGVDEDFRKQITSETQCLALTASNFLGACVLSGRDCTFESEKDCLNNGGTFHENYLCSNPTLDTKCTRQASINCAPGDVSNENEIYWYDSCGNRENIYSSDKDASWNNGMILAKKDSCGGANGVIGSTSCGNCQQQLSQCFPTTGSQTHVADGNFVCQDLGCKNAPANVGTQDRVNGESWCLYDGAVGNGTAVVGSYHWIASCINGNVSAIPCGDPAAPRSSICEQQIITDPSNPNTPNGFTTAACVANLATNCLEITKNAYSSITSSTSNDDKNSILKSMEDNCTNSQNKDYCTLKSVNVDTYFSFTWCVPKYPKGNNLTSGVDGNYCAMANINCSVVYENNGTNWAWNAIENGNCETSAFAKQMNDLCMSIGDCGSNVNYIGGGSDNVAISGVHGFVLNSNGTETTTESNGTGNAPTIYGWTNYKGNEISIKNQYVSQVNMSEELSSTFGINNYNLGSDNTQSIISTIAGAGGFGGLLGSAALTSVLGPWGAAAGIFLLGIYGGYFLGTATNTPPDKLTWMMVAGGLAGAGAAIIYLTITAEALADSGAAACSTVYGCVIGAALIIAAVIILIWLSNFKWETRYVKFECNPWQAPNGGDDCSKCNNDPLRPCTAYRCSSLGQLCTLFNADSQNPVCVSLPPSTNAPVISAGEVETDGYKFQNEISGGVGIVKSDGTDQGCIDELNPILFTLKTDGYAKCYYNFTRQNSPIYDESSGTLIDQGQYGETHTFSFSIPSINDASIHDFTQQQDANGAIVKYGKLNMYVKCEDGHNPPNYNVNEYDVNLCVRSGPDITPVNFGEVVTNPVNGAILKFGTTAEDLIFQINKPANCKYDTSKGLNYDDMQYSMNCKTGIADSNGGKWPCSTEVNLVNGTNKFYFKCKDMSGNVNTDDFVYTLTVSPKTLTIDSVNLIYGIQKINFGGEIKSGLQPISVTAEIKTSGGGYNGQSYCAWGISAAQPVMWTMSSDIYNPTTTHDQIITEAGGDHTLYIDCIDDAGNEAITSGDFTVNVDTTPPTIIRAYKDGGNLKVITDKPSKCYYNTNTCIFNLNNASAISMTTSYSTTHTAPWNTGIIYHIKCEDSLGNIPDECTAEISPQD